MADMRDFFQWCSEHDYELPEEHSGKDVLEKDGQEANTSENRKRTGAKEGLYPSAYYKGQYPANDKTSHAADSATYQDIGSKADTPG